MESAEQDERQAQYLRAIFDTIPHPTFIVDADVRVHDYNTAAEAFLGGAPVPPYIAGGGEVLHCVNAERNGCGRAPRCRDCIIRNSIQRALAGGTTYRALQQAEVRTRTGTAAMDLLVTASLLPYTEEPRALLILEDVSQIIALRGYQGPRA